MSPVTRTPKGTYIQDGAEYYPAALLASLNIPGLPKTRQGIYRLADREGWPFINVPGKGAKDGVRYFLVPDSYFDDAAAPLEPEHYTSEFTEVLGERRAAERRKNYETAIPHREIEAYVNLQGGAGPGRVISEELIIVKVPVPEQLLRERVGSNFSHLKLGAVHGDSMEPTLSHGDQVLIDTSCDRFIEDAIYAIQQNEFLRFKRIKLRLDGSIIVRTDNPIDEEPEIYTAEEAQYFNVVGRVIPFKFGRFKV